MLGDTISTRTTAWQFSEGNTHLTTNHFLANRYMYILVAHYNSNDF